MRKPIPKYYDMGVGDAYRGGRALFVKNRKGGVFAIYPYKFAAGTFEREYVIERIHSFTLGSRTYTI